MNLYHGFDENQGKILEEHVKMLVENDDDSKW